MPTVNEEVQVSRLHNGRRDSVTTANVGDKKSIGDQAFTDSLVIILACWVIVFSTWFSLRDFNI